MILENWNGKDIKIPDSEIANLMKNLHLSEAEAVGVWLEDKGIEVNEEQEALDKKAKNSGITKTIHDAGRVYVFDKEKQKTQKARAKKENPTKEMIISKIAEILPEFAENIKIEKVGKLVTFSMNGANFSLDLVQKRK